MNSTRFSRPAVLLLAAISTISAGCATVSNFYGGFFKNQGPQQVAPSAFVQRTPGNEPPSPAPAPALSTEQPSESSEQPVPPVVETAPQPTRPPEVDQPGGISSVVQNAIQPGGNPRLNEPTTEATTEPEVGLASGQYLDLGLVVARVGDTAIYANQVLRPLAVELRNDARSETIDQFISAATDLIQRQVVELEINEVNFAAAKDKLTDEDRNLADALTIQYKAKLITEAGGSPEVARRKAAANGDDFDAMVYRQYRIYMTELYYQRKIYPLLQVGADDMRKYYRNHLADLNKDQVTAGKKPFIQPAEVHFDLLGINPDDEKSGDPDKNQQLALQSIKAAHDRAANGEDFANLFAEYNNDGGLDVTTQHTGDMGTIQKGSFSIPDIENAVWKLQPGQVTAVINTNSEYYIAKLVSREDGYVRSFEDEEVQAAIRLKLQADQFRVLQDTEQRNLLANAIIDPTPRSEERLVDMAVENYKIWNSTK